MLFILIYRDSMLWGLLLPRTFLDVYCTTMETGLRHEFITWFETAVRNSIARQIYFIYISLSLSVDSQHVCVCSSFKSLIYQIWLLFTSNFTQFLHLENTQLQYLTFTLKTGYWQVYDILVKGTQKVWRWILQTKFPYRNVYILHWEISPTYFTCEYMWYQLSISICKCHHVCKRVHK